MSSHLQDAFRASVLGVAINAVLAIVKILVGIVGHCYALIADGIESTADIASSLIVWSGLRISVTPPDEDHPYGHGKAESIAGLIVSAALLFASALIAIMSIREIITPHHSPAWYTLPVLILVIVVKESFARHVFHIGNSLESTSLIGDAWHHRSDAITSIAAFIGISIALIGGKGYESADDWAALAACSVISFNGFRLLRVSLNEIMDGSVPQITRDAIRQIAGEVIGVSNIEKCRIRKCGMSLFMDIHVEVDGQITVTEGHNIARLVKKTLLSSPHRIADVVVHIEPSKTDETS